MSFETNNTDPAQSDIDQIVESGMPSLLAMYSEEEGLFRSRRAYDTAWGQVYDAAFTDVETGETTPQQRIIMAMDNVLDGCLEPASEKAFTFAFTGQQKRQNPGAYKILFNNDAQYFHEAKFINLITELCIEGNVNAYEHFNTPEATANLLINYLGVCVCSSAFGLALPPGGIDELKLGSRIIVYGAGPTPDS